jgi:hypothetical protein
MGDPQDQRGSANGQTATRSGAEERPLTPTKRRCRLPRLRDRIGQLLAAVLLPDAREHQPRRAASIAATSIFFMSIIASNARSPAAAIASISARGVICRDTPHLSLHQPASIFVLLASEEGSYMIGGIRAVTGRTPLL